MGRDIRRVPPDWEHPKYTKDNAPYSNRIGDYIGLFDEDYQTASEEWITGFQKWIADGRPVPDWCSDRTSQYWEFECPPPDRISYRERRWTDEEATHYQLYENVSEGTPVSPAFATQQELIDYLVEYGDYWGQNREREDGRPRQYTPEAATSLVLGGYAPSLAVVNGQVMTPETMSL